jgi:hypothetical protein
MHHDKLEITDLDLKITRIQRRTYSGGAWVTGTVNDSLRFDALVFAEHAECEDYELGRSRISKLWIQDRGSCQTLFSFDRGLDVPAGSAEVQVVVDFLCLGLSDLVYGA